MKSPYTIIQRPLVTEKAMLLADENKKGGSQHVFEVARSANKIEIAKAVETLFGVKVAKVNTVLVKGKVRRQGRFSGKTANWKKAYVTLKEGEKLGELQ